jgi:hypothetical protein
MRQRTNTALFLVAFFFLAGCQSCQESASPPPPPPPTAAAAAPQQQEPAAAPAAEEGDEEIDEDALVLLAEGEPDIGPAPLKVAFTVESLLDETMKEPKYTWDFGDGSPVSNEAGPTHVYEKPGSYTASIRIVDKDGQLGWDEVDVEVEEP